MTPVDPASDVSIYEQQPFEGQMIDEKYLIPGPNPNGSYSGALIPNLGNNETIQYSVNLNIDGKVMQFDPFLKVNA